MRRLFVFLALAFTALAFSLGVYGAANPKGGLPVANFSGETVTVSGGEFSGLGNTPAFATLTVNGLATFECRNPQGHASPGQNPVEAGQGVSDPTPLTTAKNGRATIPPLSESVTAPETPTAQAVGCGGKGSDQWTVVLTGLQATSANVTITHAGTEIFCRNYELGGSSTGTEC